MITTFCLADIRTGFTFNVNSNQTNDQVSYIEVDGQKINFWATE